MVRIWPHEGVISPISYSKGYDILFSRIFGFLVADLSALFDENVIFKGLLYSENHIHGFACYEFMPMIK